MQWSLFMDHYHAWRGGGGEGDSEARMTKLTAANQKPSYSMMPKLCDLVLDIL